MESHDAEFASAGGYGPPAPTPHPFLDDVVAAFSAIVSPLGVTLDQLIARVTADTGRAPERDTVASMMDWLIERHAARLVGARYYLYTADPVAVPESPPAPAPAPAPVTVMWENDDIATVSIGDQQYPVTYDDCGTRGMTVALQLVTALTTQYGIPLHIHGTPGV